MDKPVDLVGYTLWAKAAIGSDFSDPVMQRVYETNVANIRSSVTQHSFFKDFSAQASIWADDYFSKTRSELFMSSKEPTLITKPFDSAVEKSFRLNVLWNRQFPESPKKGWVTEKNFYSAISDLVRGSLICRFVDGPEYVADQIVRFAHDRGLSARSYSQERDDGYYAFHTYIKFPVTVFDVEWQLLDANVEAEIQITTQLQEVMRSLMHSIYERQRVVSDTSSRWKWEFGSSRFTIGYLSHTLHLLEAMILESRNRWGSASNAATEANKNG